jgi:hypothetical protein
MFESKLEQNAAGQYLICWYDPERRNWNQVIEAALNKHKLDNKTPILCLPKQETDELQT